MLKILLKQLARIALMVLIGAVIVIWIPEWMGSGDSMRMAAAIAFAVCIASLAINNLFGGLLK